jgi:hypothetical protein
MFRKYSVAGFLSIVRSILTVFFEAGASSNPAMFPFFTAFPSATISQSKLNSERLVKEYLLFISIKPDSKFIALKLMFW